jgi:hypothetical protein
LGSSHPVRPVRQVDMTNQPESQREVGGWIHEDNVLPVLRHLSDFVGYGFDRLDEAAFVGALEQTDNETDDKWFQYPLEGSPMLSVRMARAVGACDVLVFVSGRISQVLAARIETLLMMLADRRV